jgi:intein-encoded DNA endonuclease-like protein
MNRQISEHIVVHARTFRSLKSIRRLPRNPNDTPSAAIDTAGNPTKRVLNNHHVIRDLRTSNLIDYIVKKSRIRLPLYASRFNDSAVEYFKEIFAESETIDDVPTVLTRSTDVASISAEKSAFCEVAKIAVNKLIRTASLE